MKTTPTPTSPQYALHQAKTKTTEQSAKVWTTGKLEQPAKFPLGKVMATAILVSLVLTCGIVAGLAFALHRYPHSWLGAWIPTSSTTVIQQQTSPTTTAVPTAVTQAARTLYGLAVDQGNTGMYTPGSVVGLAVPISNNGWLVTLPAARPSGAGPTVILPELGQPQSLNSTVDDPGSPFVFLKSTDLNQAPATIATVDVRATDGQAVWVASKTLQMTTAVARHLLPMPTSWLSSDEEQRYWVLDQPVTSLPGSAVLDSRGRFLGVVADGNRVWPLSAIQPILKQLIQGNTFDRPSLGVRYIDQSQATIVNQPAASGYLIGAAGGDDAVVPKSPADKAGIKAGDILTVIDGQTITGDLFDALGAYQPGDTITIKFLRSGKEKSATVQLSILRP